MRNHRSKKIRRPSHVISGMSKSIESNSTSNTSTTRIVTITAINTASCIQSGAIGASLRCSSFITIIDLLFLMI